MLFVHLLHSADSPKHFILAAIPIPVVNISSISSTDPDGSWTIKPWQLEGSQTSAKTIVECNKTMAKKLASAYGHPHILYNGEASNRLRHFVVQQFPTVRHDVA